jgi:hypothetical protein
MSGTRSAKAGTPRAASARHSRYAPRSNRHPRAHDGCNAAVGHDRLVIEQIRHQRPFGIGQAARIPLLWHPVAMVSLISISSGRLIGRIGWNDGGALALDSRVPQPFAYRRAMHGRCANGHGGEGFNLSCEVRPQALPSTTPRRYRAGHSPSRVRTHQWLIGLLRVRASAVIP